ncbi:MAG TPA: hypothetical protein VN861_02225 [Candidatus Acidoferrales bacterium]|nr:hypothetical protein [Candidatus Acidoferrales bacterium]
MCDRGVFTINDLNDHYTRRIDLLGDRLKVVRCRYPSRWIVGQIVIPKDTAYISAAVAYLVGLTSATTIFLLTTPRTRIAWGKCFLVDNLALLRLFLGVYENGHR